MLKDNPASLRMLRRLGPTTVEDEGHGVWGVVVELPPTGVVAPPTTAVRGAGRPAPMLRDPVHRQALRTRDQVCPWFS